MTNKANIKPIHLYKPATQKENSLTEQQLLHLFSTNAVCCPSEVSLLLQAVTYSEIGGYFTEEYKRKQTSFILNLLYKILRMTLSSSNLEMMH